MCRIESAKQSMRKALGSVALFAVSGLILGGLISIPAIPKPYVGIITISGPILIQAYADDISKMLSYARDNPNIKGVVLEIDSPGGEASVTEQIYLDLLRLRSEKPVVASIGATGASGGYYIAAASNFIYAEPNSHLGSIGAWSTLPTPEKLSEDIVTTGPFKSTGGSKSKALADLEGLRQEFVSVVKSQRGDKLKLSEAELSKAEAYDGVESLKYGLIDELGTSTMAIERAASLAKIRHYGVTNINKELNIWQPYYWPLSLFSIRDLKSQANLMPIYYYLYFESE